MSVWISLSSSTWAIFSWWSVSTSCLYSCSLSLSSSTSSYKLLILSLFSLISNILSLGCCCLLSWTIFNLLQQLETNFNFAFQNYINKSIQLNCNVACYKQSCHFFYNYFERNSNIFSVSLKLFFLIYNQTFNGDEFLNNLALAIFNFF